MSLVFCNLLWQWAQWARSGGPVFNKNKRSIWFTTIRSSSWMGVAGNR